MPRKKIRKVLSEISMETSEVESVNSKLGDTYVTSTECDLNYLEREMEDKFQELFEELESKKKFVLNNLNFTFSSLMFSVPESILNQPIDMNDESLRRIFGKNSSEYHDSDAGENSALAQTAVKRRRSRSVMEVQPLQYGVKKIDRRTSKRRRSSSLNMYKTPANKVWLQALTSAKKYTVSKPARVEETGISLKRIMRPDEEAISVTGSPLLVQPTVASAPTINIPLPGGVVMNILPKRPRGHFAVPDFDEATRQQLKMLCQQLNDMF